MSETIDPTVIAAATGLSEHEVRLVLAQLMPEWLFARYIDDDLAECDYLALRRRAHTECEDDR
ncbi:hypothetical protein ACFQL7_27900 [Halocatena marina]|uniref:Uncharacterized protein n=1 Tax=Halocatena marina TaxID=2934937 RepID=A0ABD5YV90_9EURY